MDQRLVLLDSNPGLQNACLPDHYTPPAPRDLSLGQLLTQERSWGGEEGTGEEGFGQVPGNG